MGIGLAKHVLQSIDLVHLVHLERMGSFPEEAVRFYIAELGSALAFLHEKKIIHRFVLSRHICVLRRTNLHNV